MNGHTDALDPKRQRARLCARIAEGIVAIARARRISLAAAHERVARELQCTPAELRRAYTRPSVTPPLGMRQGLVALSRHWPGARIELTDWLTA